MRFNRPRVPIGLPISAVILIIVGILVGPLIRSTATADQLARNVLLSAIPFILVFVGILLLFITLVWLIASMLNDRIAPRTYRIIEAIAIGGIVIGIIGMLQPWLFPAFKYGFMVLLFSTLFFILWSHVRPRGFHEAGLGTFSVADIEQKEIEG